MECLLGRQTMEWGGPLLAGEEATS